jgi:hypothetical protein
VSVCLSPCRQIAEICARLQFGELDSDSSVNVSEGLLHLLNDIGYPNQKLPETMPTLQLCYDLITTPEYEGFFYVNDLKVHPCHLLTHRLIPLLLLLLLASVSLALCLSLSLSR